MNNPPRLYPKTTPKEDMETWLLNHAHIILPILLVLLLLLFIGFCFAACGVSATDSGLRYNHFMDVI